MFTLSAIESFKKYIADNGLVLDDAPDDIPPTRTGDQFPYCDQLRVNSNMNDDGTMDVNVYYKYPVKLDNIKTSVIVAKEPKVPVRPKTRTIDL